MRTRVKICGITRPQDAEVAARHGADAVGLVFYPRSPRFVEMDQARAIVAAVPPFVSIVGLFVDAEAEAIRRVLSGVRIDVLQFHGDECSADCGQYARPYIKAVRMREGVDLRAMVGSYADAAGLLLDAYHPDQVGGTGLSFDWARVPSDLGKPVILAGGLTPENVAAAVRQVRPYAVDVSGGVEAAKGIKDEEKIAAFMRGVYGV